MHSWNAIETQLSFSWSSTDSVGILEFQLLKCAFNSRSTVERKLNAKMKVLYIFSVRSNQAESGQQWVHPPIEWEDLPRQENSEVSGHLKTKMKKKNGFFIVVMPGFACMPMFLHMIRASPFDTCNYINENQWKFHSSARVENQLRFNSCMRAHLHEKFSTRVQPAFNSHICI